MVSGGQLGFRLGSVAETRLSQTNASRSGFYAVSILLGACQRNQEWPIPRANEAKLRGPAGLYARAGFGGMLTLNRL